MLAATAIAPVPRSGTRGPDLEIKMVLAGMTASRLAFQPIVDLVRGTVVGYEALARFGDSGTRGPGPYLAAADRCGRSADLEAHLLGQALAARDTMPAGCFLAVNVSPHLLASPAVSGLLRAEADLTGLVLELTEHVPVENWSNAYNVVPVPATELRQALLARTTDGGPKDVAARCLTAIDTIRDQRSVPVSEPRHPDLASGKPWPIMTPDPDAAAV